MSATVTTQTESSAVAATVESVRSRIPSQPVVNIGTSGHVDHGKTTLTQAITGIWTSAHSEELRRGITIKVGYADAAFYKCDGCGPPDCYKTSTDCGPCGGNASLLRVVSFVDCPGHESLMANMLSGAAVMDGSILVIAANEKVPQPQTREHLLALQMLGMTHIVIAQNKIDLVSNEEAAENYTAIKKFVAGSVAADAPIIPISAQHNLNIDALIESLEQTIPTPRRNAESPPLMQVLRSFDVNHPGLSSSKLSGGVLGGTLLQGTLNVGDEIEIRPGIIEEGSIKAEPIVTRVVTLMSSAGKAEHVHPGGLIAIGTQLDPFYTRSDSLVGAVIGRPNDLPAVFESLSMVVRLFDTAVGTQDLVKVEKVRPQEILRLNIGTGVTVGIVSSAREAIVDAKLKKPVCASKGDRVAISRRIGERWRLIGAGTVR
jgi:translation initiation factor 2 subunit 3